MNATSLVHGYVLVFLHGKGSATDAETGQLDQSFEAARVRSGGNFNAIKRLVFTDGGGPTVTQRANLQKLLKGYRCRCAVVTTSRMARGIVAALGWFDPDIRAFQPERWEEALTYLGIGLGERQDLITEISRCATSMPQVEALQPMLQANLA